MGKEVFSFGKHDEMSKTVGEDAFYARCLPLGLTAFDNTQDKANEKLTRMFTSLVSVHYRHKDDK